MKLLPLPLKLALKALLKNKGRAFLTMLGIIIGISSVVLIVSVGEGAQSLITDSVQKIGSNLITVTPGKANDNGPPAAVYGIIITTLINEDAEAIKRLPHVVGADPRTRGFGVMSYGSRVLDGNFSGVSHQYPEIVNHPVAQGRFFTQAEERSNAKVAVLGDSIRRELFEGVNPIGKKLRIKNESFRVIGVLEKKGAQAFGDQDNEVFVPTGTSQKILLGQKHLFGIFVQVDKAENILKVEENIRKTLRYRHKIQDPSEDDFSVRSLDKALDTFKALTGGVQAFLVAIAGISLLVGGIGIMNIMLMAVKERTKEIGLRKALGAKPTQIKKQFLLETIVLTSIGGLLGVLIGMTLSLIVALVAQKLGYTWSFVISPLSIFLSVGISFLVGIVFGNYPARKASQLNPINALRYE